MRFRFDISFKRGVLKVSVSFGRDRQAEQQFEHRDNDTLVEMMPQPQYVGFEVDHGNG